MVSFVRSAIRRHVPEHVRAALLQRFDFLAYGTTARGWLATQRRRFWGWNVERAHIVKRTDEIAAMLDRRILRLDATFIDKSTWFEEMLRAKDKERWQQVATFNKRSDDLLKLIDQRFSRLEARIEVLEGACPALIVPAKRSKQRTSRDHCTPDGSSLLEKI